jgi:hypothetical protein
MSRDGDAMMIIVRRTQVDPCFPRRTICWDPATAGAAYTDQKY